MFNNGQVIQILTIVLLVQGEENIDFMPTILSRFDMIFIVKDEHDQQRDIVSKYY